MERKFRSKFDSIFEELKNHKGNIAEFEGKLSNILDLISQKSIYPSKLIRFLRLNMKSEKIMPNEGNSNKVLRPIIECLEAEKSTEESNNFLKILHFYSFTQISSQNSSVQKYLTFLMSSINNPNLKKQILSNICDVLETKNESFEIVNIEFSKILLREFKERESNKGEIDALEMSFVFRALYLASKKFSEHLNEKDIQEIFFTTYKFLFVGTSFGSSLIVSEGNCEDSGLSDFSSKKDTKYDEAFTFTDRMKNNAVLLLQNLIILHKNQLKQVWNNIFKCDFIKCNYLSLIKGSKKNPKTSETIEIQKLFHAPTINFLILNCSSQRFMGNLTNFVLNIMELLPMKLILPMNPDKIESKKEHTFISQSFFLYNCLKNLIISIILSMNKCKIQNNSIYSLINVLLTKGFLIKLPKPLKISLCEFLSESFTNCEINNQSKVSILNSVSFFLENEAENDIYVIFKGYPSEIVKRLKISVFRSLKDSKADCLTLEFLNFLASSMSALQNEYNEVLILQMKDLLAKILKDIYSNEKEKIFVSRLIGMMKFFEKTISKQKEFLDLLVSTIQCSFHIKETDIFISIFSLICNLSAQTFFNIMGKYPSFLKEIIDLRTQIPKKSHISYFSAIGAIALYGFNHHEEEYRCIFQFFLRENSSDSTSNVNLLTKISWAHCNWISILGNLSKGKLSEIMEIEVISSTEECFKKYSKSKKEKISAIGIRGLGILACRFPFVEVNCLLKIFVEELNSKFSKVHWNCLFAISCLFDGKLEIDTNEIENLFSSICKFLKGNRVIKSLAHSCSCLNILIEKVSQKEEKSILLIEVIEEIYRDTQASLLQYEDFKLNEKFKQELGFLILKLLSIIFSSKDYSLSFVDRLNRKCLTYFSLICNSFYQYSEMEKEKEVTIEEEEEEKTKEMKNVLIGNTDEILVKGIDQTKERIIDLSALDLETKGKIKGNLELLVSFSSRLSIFIDSNTQVSIPFYLYNLINELKMIEIEEKTHLKLLLE